MKQIPLSQGLYAIVDDDDYEKIINGPKWYALRKGTKLKPLFYAVRNIKISATRKTIQYMHRIIRCERVDHINHNGLDNRKENLRSCTPSQNMMNTRERNNKSGYRGVFQEHPNTFRASISIHGKIKRVGVFRTSEEAARAYDAAAVENYGQFAKLNFPD